MSETQDETAVRLDNHSKRLVSLEEDAARTIKRVTDLESDRETVHNLVTTIGLLAAKVQELAQGVDAIAETAVKKVLAQRASSRKEGWKHSLQLIATGAGGLGAVLGVLKYVFALHF